MIGKDLFDDLETIAAGSDVAVALTEQGIQSYDDLFWLIQNDNLSLPIRSAVFTLIEGIAYAPDRRRTVPLLLKFLGMKNSFLRAFLAENLGRRQSRRAVVPLLALLHDKSEVLNVRREAARALCFLDDERAIPALRTATLDPDEAPSIRAEILEWMRDTPDTVADCITLLGDKSTDVRFWAAYRLSQSFRDTFPAFHALDHAAAYDHELPQGWGWHIDREALYGLEMINLKRLGYADSESDKPSPRSIRIISPHSEFLRFMRNYRKMVDVGLYETKAIPEIDLKIETDWLRLRIQQIWPHTRFETREPRPVTYALNWTMQIDTQPLIGGLHRNGDLLVLSGARMAIFAFAAWYRALLTPHISLWMYQWAGEGFELKLNMSSADIDKEDAEHY